MTKLITKSNYENALDADPTRTPVVHRSQLVDNFPRDNELPNFSSNYEKPFNDDKKEHFYNEFAKYRLSHMNQPMDSFDERQHLNDYLPIFPDICGPSREDTSTRLLAKGNSWLSTPNPLANSPVSGIQQSSPHTPLSFQSESPVITSQPTAPSSLPRASVIIPTYFPSISTGTSPRSRNAGNILQEILPASGTESHISKNSPFSLFLY